MDDSLAETTLRERLREAFAPQEMEIVDESGLHAGHAGANASGVGSHFRVRIVADAFRGLPRVRRHRLVYDVLRAEDDTAGLVCGIHALALSVLTPEEAAGA